MWKDEKTNSICKTPTSVLIFSKETTENKLTFAFPTPYETAHSEMREWSTTRNERGNSPLLVEWVTALEMDIGRGSVTEDPGRGEGNQYPNPVFVSRPRPRGGEERGAWTTWPVSVVSYLLFGRVDRLV